MGFEPMTPALQERCSGQLSYSGGDPEGSGGPRSRRAVIRAPPGVLDSAPSGGAPWRLMAFTARPPSILVTGIAHVVEADSGPALPSTPGDALR